MIQRISEFVFWLSAAFLCYVYVGYPIVLALLARLAPQKTKSSESFLPPVTILISAYNESKVITAKLENSLSLDYPKDRLEILVISDCSDDGTDEIVGRYAASGVRLIRQQQRLGKSAGLNLGVAHARGEILVFSDANALYRPNAVRQLVRHFADPGVGYVVGHARYLEHSAESPSARSEGLYWKLETCLKKKESRFYSVVGGDGAIYAIRRDLYTPLLPTDINDFLNPLQIIARGYLGVFEPAAVSDEEAAESFTKEFRRKVRIISRSLNAIWRATGTLQPWRKPRHWFMLISHKVLRWFAPLPLLLLVLTALLLCRLPFYRMAALLQIGFYALALLGYGMRERGSSWKIVYLPYYFCLVNVASLLGILKCFRGALSPTWQTVRQEPAGKQSSKVYLARRDA